MEQTFPGRWVGGVSMALAQKIGEQHPLWALWGGSFTLFGLFARTFHSGGFHIVSALSGAILFGWILLAIGAYLSRTLGLIRSIIAPGLMSALMLGILKGSSATSVAAVSGLCVALVPLGIEMLTARPRPQMRTALAWSAVRIAVAVALFILGQLG